MTEQVTLTLGEPEASRQSSENVYEPLWVNQAEALALNVVPADVLGFIETLL